MPYNRTFNWEPSRRWVRGYKGAVAVVDSRAAVLVWEPGHPVPRYAFPEADVRTDLLRPAENPPVGTHEGATRFFDLVVDGEVAYNAAFEYPDLPGYLSLEWFQRAEPVLDRWLEEEEEIFVHPRDPYKRVDPIPSSRHVRIEIGGQVVAESHEPVLLYETGLPTRYYIPPKDVNFDLLVATDTHTRCPYKGEASYWSLREPVEGVPADVAWAYPDPIPAAAAIKDHVAFYNEVVDIVVDGVKEKRPATLFSKRLAEA
ncbi:DUF427 domain-containing protein [Planotetraspora sp. A-T 1434]|uniref:DUF427 domain-containing protein n=1 Tax=Planotetraspora sp. A-T 1434 TaxID=2979219 RepID=UPI0021C06BF4|nr:DUF427 domain-containing protein [Planotetraspora sp. A-T 1434]MCT9934446.1 DUF427 domain-containing protein [Planotetraspora sp. A-T 1434]